MSEEFAECMGPAGLTPIFEKVSPGTYGANTAGWIILFVFYSLRMLIIEPIYSWLPYIPVNPLISCPYFHEVGSVLTSSACLLRSGPAGTINTNNWRGFMILAVFF